MWQENRAIFTFVMRNSNICKYNKVQTMVSSVGCVVITWYFGTYYSSYAFYMREWTEWYVFLDGPATSQKKKTGHRLHICFRSVLDNIFFIFSTTTDNNTNISKLPY